jgi:hypothetical protein
MFWRPLAQPLGTMARVHPIPLVLAMEDDSLLLRSDRCDARPVRRAAGGFRALTPPWPEGPKSGKRRPRPQRLPDGTAR